MEPGTFRPLARLSRHGAHAIVTDHLGTPIRMYDRLGRESGTLDFTVYGKEHGAGFRGWMGCPFRYPGQYADAETGLYYNRFRYYDPVAGQYISQDPIGLAGGNPTLYGYVGDVGVEVDLLGLKPCFANAESEKFAETIIGKHGGKKLADGHYQMPNRRRARQAASEIAGNMGNNPTMITKADFRGGPQSWRGNSTKIGQQSSKKSSGWRDDSLGHDFGSGNTIGPHVNAWNKAKGVFDNLHLLY